MRSVRIPARLIIDYCLAKNKNGTENKPNYVVVLIFQIHLIEHTLIKD